VNDDLMVAIDHLGKNFDAEAAVQDVSLAVKRGEFVTLLGPSGCGKTTTLRCIAGLERPDAGEIRIGGEIVASPARGIHFNPEDRNIDMVFQSYAVWPHMTVFENVAYGLRVRRAPRAVMRERTMRTLELVGLGHLADRYATKLSGGQRQRIAPARPSCTNPRRCCLTSRCRTSTPNCAANADRTGSVAKGRRHHLDLRHARPDRSAGDERPRGGD
jgi:ABC-type Fe3+/spermidine/putrescine transport system ATPase subunit